ncbi:hypothetical protein NXS19_002177 [Fusarium pseudograminearum]|nr:hypothetical protein NXS19_002177 [Fusarium pseudograminearum]
MYPNTLTAIAALSFVPYVAAQAQGTATVNLAQGIGKPQALGSGFIYGFPDNGTHADKSIPDNLITDIKFNANRGGGAQIPAPGWATGGLKGYQGRFQSSLSNYLTTRKYNADFILLPHDLWGADGGQSSESPFPGDNGNFTEMEVFWKQLISDLKANNMLQGLVIDVWNEPDITSFWNRPWPQYLDYYNRATKLIRKELPGAVLSGPSMADSPNLKNSKWSTWVESVAGNGTIPDRFSWHQIGTWSREPDVTIPDFATLRARSGVPMKPVDVNEYAALEEQNPANSVYYLAQLERYNIRGLRANWASGSELHNWMGNLVYSTTGTSTGTYYPNGEWQVYKYYAAMTGERVSTVAAADKKFDVFATKDGKTVKILAGTRTIKAAYDITVNGLNAVGFPKQGLLRYELFGSTGLGRRERWATLLILEQRVLHIRLTS